MRQFRLLSRKYVQGQCGVQVYMDLGISQSEYYRAHTRALEALTAIIGARLAAPTDSGPVTTPSPIRPEARWTAPH